MNATSASQSPASARRIPKMIALCTIGLLGFVLLAYFLVTSNGFLKAFVLPRVGKSLGAALTADSLSISPLSSARIRGLKVSTGGTEPLLSVNEVFARFSLMDLMGGTLTVKELTVDTPALRIVATPDGRDSLQPLLDAQTQSPATPGSSGSKPPRLNLQNISIRNASFRKESTASDKSREVLEVHKAVLTLDRLIGVETGQLGFSGEMRADMGTNGTMQGNFQGNLKLALSEALVPRELSGAASAVVSQSSGRLSALQGFSPILEADVTPSEVRRVQLRFEQNARALGVFNVSGPFDAGKTEGKLQLAISGINDQVLNPLGAAFGLSFGKTSIRGSSELEIRGGGKVVQGTASLSVDQFNLVQGDSQTPPVDLSLACDLSADFLSKTGILKSLQLKGTQAGRTLISSALSAPMNLAWGAQSAGAGEASLDLMVSDLNLADWKSFLGGPIEAGNLSGRTRLTAQSGGKKLMFEKSGEVQGLDLSLGDPPFRQGTLKMRAAGELLDFGRMELKSFKVDLSRDGRVGLSSEGTAAFDKGSGAFSLKAGTEIVSEVLLGSGFREPLAVGVSGEGTWTQPGRLDLKEASVTLSPTPRAASNTASLRGRLDLSKPGGMEGALSLRSQTLDLTRLWELVSPPGQVPPPVESEAPIAFPKEEPGPAAFGIRSLRLDAELSKVFLGEIEASGVKAGLSCESSRFRLEPASLTLNGAPVTLKMTGDLSQSAPSYEVSWDATGIPVQPLVNTFTPQFKGMVSGNLSSRSQIKGVGVTGANLQKSLVGDVSILLTNANIQALTGSARLWIIPINLNLIASLLRVPELAGSPIHLVDVRATMGEGLIRLHQALVQGDAVAARAVGVVRIADRLDDSAVDVPLEIALVRTLAQRANLMSADTPAEVTYVPLPPIARLRGTLSRVETKTDKAQIAALVLKATTGVAGGVAADAVQGVAKAASGVKAALGGLFGGRRNESSTNAVSTNQPSRGNPLNLFKKKQ